MFKDSILEKLKLIFVPWLKSAEVCRDIIVQKLKPLQPVLLKYWLLFFYISAISYFELVYRLWNFKSINFDFIFPVIFAFPAGVVLFLISSAIGERTNRIITVTMTSLITLGFGMQLVYFSVFHIPLSFYSLSGAVDALQFGSIIASAILRNIIGIILLFIPLILLLVKGRKLHYDSIKPPSLYYTLIFLVSSYFASIICVNLTNPNNISQRTLYYDTFSPELPVMKL